MSARKRKTIAPKVSKGEVPAVSTEYIIKQLEDYAKHLDDARQSAGKTPKARSYRIAVEHIQTAILWVANADSK